MCKIITILNKNKRNIPLLNTFLRANISELQRERDGYAVYEFNNGKGERKTFVGDGYKDVAKNIEYKGGETYMVHFRTKTSGEEGEAGLHLDKIQDRYVYAHNGTASKFSNAKTKSDSYHFFNGLLARGLNGENIANSIKESNFWGRAFIFDEKENRLHVFCNYYVEVYGLKDCLVLSSYMMNTKVNEGEVKIILGFPFYAQKDKEIPLLGEADFSNEYLTFTNGVLDHDEFLDTYSKGKKEPVYNPKDTFWNPESGMLEPPPSLEN